MRTLKFRVWNKLLKSFDNSSYNNEEEYYSSPANCFLWALKDCLQDENLVIQQFTGLLDKNGKEIYEGDILRVEYDLPPEYNSKPFIDFVDFYDGNFVLDNHREGIGECYHSSVVIGNIFENEELMCVH